MPTCWRCLSRTWISTWGDRSRLDEQHLLEKIVASRRGGFCYELNGLFAWLLRELGFQVDLLSAEVFEGGTFSPEFDHLALRVRMEDDWLADVGFGDSFIRPLKLTSGEEQVQREKTYRLESDSDYWILTMRGNAGEWEPYYRFNAQTAGATGFSRPLPIPPDFARVPIYTEACLHAADRRRAINAERQAPDRDPERPAAGDTNPPRGGKPGGIGKILRDQAA